MPATVKWLGKVLVAAAALAGFPFATAKPAVLSFSFTDPAGDSGAAGGDLTSLSFVFDNTTGAYTINLTADPAKPFFGAFRINVNLLNPDTAPNRSFFASDENDFNLSTATTTIALSGANTLLESWTAGERVAANNYPFGNPPGETSFVTNLADLPGGGIFCSSGQDCLGPLDTTNFTTIAPEPGSETLAGGSLVALALTRRWRRLLPR